MGLPWRTIAAAAVGVGLGGTSRIRPPASSTEAERDSDPKGAAIRAGRDIALGGIDDALFWGIARVARNSSRLAKWTTPLKVAETIFGAAGAIAAGDLVTREGREFIAARDFLAASPEAGDGRPKWETSLGTGHLLTIIPHSMISQAGPQIAAPRPGKHATNTLQSNNPRRDR